MGTAMQTTVLSDSSNQASDGESAGQATGVSVGQTIAGTYLVKALLGRGGMGEVYQGVDLRTGKPVALKLPRQMKKHSQSYLRRFRREIAAQQAIRHPNVVAAIDVIESLARPILVLEFVNGPNLLDVVEKNGPLPFAAAARLILQAARGLACCHRHGFVHRDVKPANLLLERSRASCDPFARRSTGSQPKPCRQDACTTQGTVKVADLGLVRKDASVWGDSSDAPLTDPGTITGTLDFIAPEQVCDGGAVDRRADVFSLAATLYYLLTGQSPLGEGNLFLKLERLRTVAPAPVSALAADVPPGLDELLAEALAKDPAQRPVSVTDFARRLARLLRPVSCVVRFPSRTSQAGARNVA